MTPLINKLIYESERDRNVTHAPIPPKKKPTTSVGPTKVHLSKDTEPSVETLVDILIEALGSKDTPHDPKGKDQETKGNEEPKETENSGSFDHRYESTEDLGPFDPLSEPIEDLVPTESHEIAPETAAPSVDTVVPESTSGDDLAVVTDTETPLDPMEKLLDETMKNMTLSYDADATRVRVRSRITFLSRNDMHHGSLFRTFFFLSRFDSETSFTVSRGRSRLHLFERDTSLCPEET
jgi:hypothetical protein